MQRLARASTGENLPIFGRDLFQRAPSTFAPADQIPALSDYVVGPGDELLVRLWGPESFNGQLTIDSSGSIYVPQVGAIHVAGLRADQLQAQISANLQHSFRNFNLSVNLGHLRSIQVYVVGEGRRPGAYTVSSLSTILNVLFVSGGPNVQGSLRHIQVRRGVQVASELDLYDLLLRGDKSKDIRLESNDTIFIPAAGPQAAIAGSVRHPAIYELAAETTAGDLIQLAGGFTPTGSTSQISLERIGEGGARAALTLKLDEPGRATRLRDGDVLLAGHITAAFEQSVTIRGNLANPGRFPWHPGMRLSEIIPDRMSLLTNEYWQQRNRLGLPVPLFEPLRRDRSRANAAGRPQDDPDNGAPATSTEPSGEEQDQQPAPEDSQINSPNRTVATDARLGAADTQLTRGTLADEQQAAQNSSLATKGNRVTIKIPAPEIDWSYAVIERLNPNTLKSELVPFNLQKLVQDQDPRQDLPLQSGDVVTILSQSDVHVPQDDQTKYVRLEGEFLGSGVYSVGPNETLEQVVRRAGGLSSKAYLFGASFTRESARVLQQQRLDEYISQLAITMQRDAAVRSASSATGIADPNAVLEQREIISQLRKLRATGRIVLEVHPNSAGIESIPDIPLEDGDVFRVPSRPLTVAVIGAVYGQNVFIYNPRHRLEDYLDLAGKPNNMADERHAFVIRADGSVFSRERARGTWKNSFNAAPINPGDSIVIPEKPVRPSAIREIVDYSQIISQFALGAAALSVIK